MEIDRAIEILSPTHREHYDGLEEVNEACRMGMEALKRQRWIPATEPPKIAFKIYQVAVAAWPDEHLYSRIGHWNGTDWLTEEKRKIMTKRVAYWMPLPEPPKDGGSENAPD